MQWNDFVGMDGHVAYFRRSIASGRTVHAYLIYGPEGSGKHTLTDTVCAALHCRGDEKPCGVCSACKKLRSGNHPDHMVIQNEKDRKTIGVDAIRELVATVAMRPNEGGVRTIVFDKAEIMTPEAQNVLLKTLEEPPEHTKLFLLVQNKDSLLPTVRSRCMEIQMPRLSREQLCGLVMKNGFSREKAAQAASAADGIAGRALFLAGQDDTQRTELFDSFFSAGGDAFKVWPVYEKYKDDAERMFSLTGELLRDILVYQQTGNADLLLHVTYKEQIQKAAQRIDTDKLRSMLRAVEQSAADIQGNRNASIYQMAVERMLFTVVEGKQWRM